MYMPYAGDTRILYHYTTEDLVRIYISPFKKIAQFFSTLVKTYRSKKLSMG